MIVLNVCTGRVAGKLADHLLNLGEQVTVIHRDGNKAEVPALAARGARVVLGAFDDEATLDAAFAGAKAVYWMFPTIFRPDFVEWATKATQLAATVAARHNVGRFVYLSGIGAQSGAALGAAALHLPCELALLSKLRNVAVLRPGFYMENWLLHIGTVVGQGAVYYPEINVPFVATIDVAKRAAAYLTNEFKGQHTVGIHGPQDLSTSACWAIISKAIGTPVNYVSIAPEQLGAGLKGFGLPDFIADGFAAMMSAFQNGVAWPAEQRTPETCTQTSLHEWAVQVFKPAFDAATRPKA